MIVTFHCKYLKNTISTIFCKLTSKFSVKTEKIKNNNNQEWNAKTY